jgi:hypothetical protein
MSSPLQRANKRAEINEVLAILPFDELCVILQVAQGLKQGLIQYGELNLDSSDRNWLTEMEAELRDMINYAGMKLEILARMRQREALEEISRLGQEQKD